MIRLDTAARRAGPTRARSVTPGCQLIPFAIIVVPLASTKRREPPAPEAHRSIRRLRRNELPVDTEALARYLIGKTLVHEHPAGRLAGRIVETEAYVVGDAAAHAFRGLTQRNRSLFLPRGHAYVYFVYGCWFALNVSGETAGIGAGVLLRALEPIEGVALMQARRGHAEAARSGARARQARHGHGHRPALRWHRPVRRWPALAGRRRYDRSAPIGESVRIGLTREVDRKLRFFEYDNAFVSGPRRLRT